MVEAVPIRMVDADLMDELAQGLMPLGQGLGHGRYLVGLAGIPGAGKSTLAQRVAAALNGLCPGVVAVVSLDGFHWSNRRLEEVGLRERKGSPATFDVQAFLDFLTLAKTGSVELTFPVYDRHQHEPVRRAIPEQTLDAHRRIVLVEGNYLLLDHAPWSALAAIFDQTWWLETSLALARQWILARHGRGGRSEADALAHYQRNDLPNARLILEHSRMPDLRLCWP